MRDARKTERDLNSTYCEAYRVIPLVCEKNVADRLLFLYVLLFTTSVGNTVMCIVGFFLVPKRGLYIIQHRKKGFRIYCDQKIFAILHTKR